MAKIGVFDSGVGGLSVANTLQVALPHDEIIFRCDREHMPYGSKPPSQVLSFVVPILQSMIAEGCDVIVIACNTVTTTLINDLRECSTVPLVGIEPMIKPAAKLTKTGIIGVCATPATLASQRYAWLKQTYGSGLTILEPDCSQWASLIEHDSLNEKLLRGQIDWLCQQGADVIVLGCTHYHWIQKLITSLARGRATIIQPEQAIVRRVGRVLEKLTAPEPLV
jgi:glutamate racemase